MLRTEKRRCLKAAYEKRKTKQVWKAAKEIFPSMKKKSENKTEGIKKIRKKQYIYWSLTLFE